MKPRSAVYGALALVSVVVSLLVVSSSSSAGLIVADVAITKTDGVTQVSPGGSTTYTITATNSGPDAVSPEIVDDFPASLTNVSWSCSAGGGATCTGSGSGDIDDFTILPVGGSVTYTAMATVDPSATGTISNTASILSGASDATPGDHSATDTDTVVSTADLSIFKTDNEGTVTAGGSTTYTIAASNSGPNDVNGATVTDTFPPSVTNVSWTCSGMNGGACGTAAGTGDISETVNLPSNGSVTYTAIATIDPAATGTLENTATVAAPAGVDDDAQGNNSSTDLDTIQTINAELSITKTDNVTTVTAGEATP